MPLLAQRARLPLLGVLSVLLSLVPAESLRGATPGAEERPVAPAPHCDLQEMHGERALLLEPALELAHAAAGRAVLEGRSATQTIDRYATAYWWAVHALDDSSEWQAWKERWRHCANGSEDEAD